MKKAFKVGTLWGIGGLCFWEPRLQWSGGILEGRRELRKRAS